MEAASSPTTSDILNEQFGPPLNTCGGLVLVTVENAKALNDAAISILISSEQPPSIFKDYDNIPKSHGLTPVRSLHNSLITGFRSPSNKSMIISQIDTKTNRITNLARARIRKELSYMHFSFKVDDDQTIKLTSFYLASSKIEIIRTAVDFNR